MLTLELLQIFKGLIFEKKRHLPDNLTAVTLYKLTNQRFKGTVPQDLTGVES
jgi:hypothetical protein